MQKQQRTIDTGESMTPTVCLVVLSASKEELVLPGDIHDEVAELVVVLNPGGRFGGLGAIAERVMCRTVCDVFGIVHADVSFEHGAITRLAQTAYAGAVSGLVGCNIEGSIVWGRSVPEGRCEPVSTLDSCCLFVRPNMGAQWDTATFGGFHCCVEDFCLTAASRGVPVVVPDVKGDHLGSRYQNAKWLQDFAVERRKLVTKWAGTDFRTTTG